VIQFIFYKKLIELSIKQISNIDIIHIFISFKRFSEFIDICVVDENNFGLCVRNEFIIFVIEKTNKFILKICQESTS
jgi:hypothetical protein